jgi:hypothetical protein
MDDAVADGVTSCGWKVKESPSMRVDSCMTANSSVMGKGPLEALDLGADHDGDACDCGIGVVDDAVDVGAEVVGVVDAEVDLADAHVEHQHLARRVVISDRA